MSDDRPVAPFKDGVRQPTIIRYEFMPSGTLLTVPFQVIQNDALSEELVRKLWQVAQQVGIGAMRHLQGGKFEVEELTAGEMPTLPFRLSTSRPAAKKKVAAK